MTDNDLILYYTSVSPYTQIRDWIKAGWGMTWGIISSVANDHNFSQFSRVLAPWDNVNGHFGSWGGEVFPTGGSLQYKQIIVKYTYWGDANADGRVDPTDYAIVDGKQGIGSDWISGDLNFDGKVDPTDYAQIDGNQGAGQGGAGGPRL